MFLIVPRDYKKAVTLCEDLEVLFEFLKNGELTQLILGDDKKTVINL